MKEELLNIIRRHNIKGEGIFIPISPEEYVKKIINNATITTYFSGGKVQAFIAYYNNDTTQRYAFLTIILVAKELQGKGIGKSLLEFSIQDLKKSGFKYYGLEVLKQNHKAINLYKKYGFLIKEDRKELWLMEKEIK